MTDSQQPHSAARRWPGFFLVIEGIDGTGKSTLGRALADRLRAAGVECLLTREPTDGPYGQKIRELAKSGRESVSADEEVDLFVIDRKEHLEKEMLPALLAGNAVILDRYYYSTMAYQSSRGANLESIRAKHAAFAPEPDLLVILELEVSAALERIRQSRGDGPDHFEGAEYLQKVARVFEGVTHPNLLRLDAKLPTEAMVEAVLQRMGEWVKEKRAGLEHA